MIYRGKFKRGEPKVRGASQESRNPEIKTRGDSKRVEVAGLERKEVDMGAVLKEERPQGW